MPFSHVRTMDELEVATSHSIIGRRNMLIGVWAGEQLGLGEDALFDYVRSVMDADLLEPGPQDVINKVRSDFAGRGIAITEAGIASKLRAIELQLRHEFHSTD